MRILERKEGMGGGGKQEKRQQGREKAVVNQAFPFSSYQVADLALAHPPDSGSFPHETF